MERKTFATRPSRVALFVTCMVDMLYPEVGMATVELLEAQGVEVHFPFEQTCCGQPAFNAGFRDEARTMARHFLDVFTPLLANGAVEAIVAPSGSCAAMVRNHYVTCFEAPEFAADRARAEVVAAATFEITEFLVDVLGVSAVPARAPVRLAYHACCHTLRELGVDRQPRLLLGSLQDAEPITMQGEEECCGFGGLFALKNAAISEAMGRTKAQNIVASGADVVALCDVSCMTHINGLLSRQGQHARAVHITQVLTGAAAGAPSDETHSGAPDSGEGAARQPAPVPPAQATPRRWQDVK